MRYSSDRYATAFLDAVGAAPAAERPKRMRRFVATVAKHGDLPRMDQIVAAIERRLIRERGGRWVRVTFARPPDEQTVASFKKRFPDPDHVEVVVEPKLIAGARITIDGEEELDQSFSRKLRKLFSGQ